MTTSLGYQAQHDLSNYSNYTSNSASNNLLSLYSNATTVTLSNKPIYGKKSHSSSIGTNGPSKYLASPELLRCKRRVNINSLAYSIPTATPIAVARRNERERNRVKMVNMGFHTLRQHIPNGSKNKKMSKVETLRSAVEYIRQLQLLLNADNSSTSYSTRENVSISNSRSPDENVNPTLILTSSHDSASYSPLSSYDSVNFIPNRVTITTFETSDKYSPVSPNSPTKSSICSDMSSSSYEPVDTMEKTCVPEEEDLFDFATLLS